MDTAIIITDDLAFKGVYIVEEDDERLWIVDSLGCPEWIGIPKSRIKTITRSEPDSSMMSQIACSSCDYTFLALHKSRYKGEFCCPKCSSSNPALEKWSEYFEPQEFSEFRDGIKIKKV